MDETSNAAPPPVFRWQRRVEFADTDMGGIVHFSRFFRYMEEAEHAFLRSLGRSVIERNEAGVLTWPRVSATCDYRSPARFEDLLDIAVSIATTSRKTVTYQFGITNAGRPIATGQLVVVCCRVSPDHQIQSIDIPPDLRAQLLA